MWGIMEKNSKMMFRFLTVVSRWMVLIFTEKGSLDIGVKLFGKQDTFIFGWAEFEVPNRYLIEFSKVTLCYPQINYVRKVFIIIIIIIIIIPILQVGKLGLREVLHWNPSNMIKKLQVLTTMLYCLLVAHAQWIFAPGGVSKFTKSFYILISLGSHKALWGR